ncbi:MAG: peptide chain release factor N(5)-glutamine methyltransferase [Candidatus Magasanikbacteria bacterium]|jgi:release factor glutamine methyltransferase|nr:peptide chain release factor N(5)-glutamine methyltransferase [Candidatus Magasanikbacteria bacterium]MBT4071124.1 peptide chain release factor N(5)-glutamine methyltransferase [Candidatus Magasanikbacteria bacterium]
MKKTIQDLLTEAIKSIELFDAQLLLAHVINTSREFVIAHPEYKINCVKKFTYFQLVKKRNNGIPLAYLTCHKEFYGLDFFVNKYTLVPRPDTELMVDLVIKKIKEHKIKNAMLLDVGTGSGCIPISIATKVNIKTIATDISKKAIKVAKKNAEKHKVNLTCIHGSLLEQINDSLFLNNSSLIITANLPYLTDEQFNKEPSIQHEPKNALVAADNGLALYKELLEQINKKQITKPLTLFLEIDPTQSEKISIFIKKVFQKSSLHIHKDLSGHDRVVEIVLQ